MELYPGVKISIGPPIADGFYYDFDFPDGVTLSEADLPRIEDIPGQTTRCNRQTGANCVNPPPGANFYPFYSTRAQPPTGCAWQLGGGGIPGTVDTFGGTSTAEFGQLLDLVYPGTRGVIHLIEDFRQVLASNPCTNTRGG
jgi:hypothetical protein